MHSIRTKFTMMTIIAIIVAMSIATLISVLAVMSLGSNDADQMLMLACRTGEKNLDSYFESVERSVKTVSALVQDRLADLTYDEIDDHVERARNLFTRIAHQTSGVLTYYYRIDPRISQEIKGFWYVNTDDEGFVEHDVTDITLYDTEDTSQLVWFTIPKATGKGVWLSPYFKENLDVRVISYNAPVYWSGRFIGVIGIEIDYDTLVDEVKNLRVYENGYAFIVDGEGNLVYHPYIDTALLAPEELPERPVELLSDEPSVQYSYGGVEKAAVWLPLSNGMRLYVSVPVNEINGNWQGLIRNILLASFIVLVLVSIITMNFASHLTKPLRDLTAAAEQVDNGDFDFRLDYNKNDEVGILTRTFSRLAMHMKEHISKLNQRAYRDALTSVRNKGAFADYLGELQEDIDRTGVQPAFGVCVFDCDDLKKINDRFGHDKGDIYIKTASRFICSIFLHSPVFRIGGDEFAVVLVNEDYENRDALIEKFMRQRENAEAKGDRWTQPSVTMGYVVYDPKIDQFVLDTVRRADKQMYANKHIRKIMRSNTPFLV